jgi:hypothetical protein
MRRLQRGSITVWIIVIAMILFLAGGFVWLYFRDHASSQTQTAEKTGTTGQPQIKVTDFSQGTSANEKTAVLVEHSDSTFEKFILDNGMVASYVKGLPPGEKVVSQTPLK